MSEIPGAGQGLTVERLAALLNEAFTDAGLPYCRFVAAKLLPELGSAAPAPAGPWRVVSPAEYAGSNNPFIKGAKWIVRSDSHPGESAIIGSEAEAITVRDALNRVARSVSPSEEKP